MGRRICVATLVCLVFAALLTSAKLVEIAERQPLGASRDRWVDIAEAVDRTANFLSFNRPYDQIADWRGLGEDVGERLDTVGEVVDALEDAQPPEAPTAPATPGEVVDIDGKDEPPATAEEFFVVTPDRPLLVHVAGDSQANDVGHTLRGASEDRFEVAVNSRNSTNLARPDYFNWPAELLKVSIKDDPDVVVLFLGASEWQNMETRDGSLVEPGTPEWLEEWSWRLSVILDILSAEHRLVAWVGLPPMHPNWIAEGVPAINAAAEAVIARYPQAVMVDIWDLFGGEDYTERVSPPGGGDPVRVRMDDGIHLNRTGSSWVSEEVVKAVAAVWEGRCGSPEADEAEVICWRAAESTSQVGDLEPQTCAELPNGEQVCWSNDRSVPIFRPEDKYASVSASWNQVCALKADNSTVACWGDDLDGRANIPEGPFESVVAGAWHACGIRSSGQVVCWGTQVANMSAAPEGSYTEVSIGARHSCALTAAGEVTCWGDNERGRAAAPDIELAMVSAGGFHSCGLRVDLTAFCWGDDAHGQASPPSGKFQSLSAGNIHTCGLRTDGMVECWGANLFGESDAPEGEFTSVATAERHTCGLRTNGSAVCWGNDDHGRASPPEGVFLSLDAGGNISCGIRPDQSVECWGRELAGQIFG